jgi:hypothetical protein
VSLPAPREAIHHNHRAELAARHLFDSGIHGLVGGAMPPLAGGRFKRRVVVR